jgi:hypothetical protein
MRARNRLLTMTAIFAVIVLIAALLGRRSRGVIDPDPRASTFVHGPGGVSGVWDALPALGVGVRRLRARPRALPRDSTPGRAAILVLNPSAPISPLEVHGLLEYNARSVGGGDLVVAGSSASELMRCFGYEAKSMGRDSARAFDRSSGRDVAVWVRATLAPASSERETTPTFRGAAAGCEREYAKRTDTLLTTTHGPVALLLQRDRAGEVILIADVGVFRNRRVRETSAGPFILTLLAGRYSHVTFDEYHHGYGSSGSLARAVTGWSARSPLGWAVWQAAIVGVLALLIAGIRFGPPRTVLQRTRRAPMEHVRALATALASARGHDVAISILVRGLRRRLLPAGRATRAGAEDARRWIDSLERRGLPRESRSSLETLKHLMKPGQDEAAVLRAANAVEDVWDTLRHSAATSWRH